MQVAHVRLLRRSMIGIIVSVLLAVAFNYLQTWRRNARIITQAAQVLSPDMMRSADSIEYSTYENGQVRFKIHAERLLETRQGRNLLQGVEGSDRNPDGTVGNQIRSLRAEYDPDHKLVDFSGNVQLDIGPDVQIRTNFLHYDLNTNLGSTDDKLQFATKEAQGTAQGVLYNQARKTLELKKDLDVTLARSIGKQDESSQTEHIRARARRGYYSREERLLRFEGDAHLDSESAALSGDLVEARFSEDQKHIASLVCERDAVYVSKDAQQPRTMRGNQMLFGIDPKSGSLQSIDIAGQAVFSSKAETGDQELHGDSIRMEVDPTSGLPTHIQSQGGVHLRMKREADETVVEGGKLDTLFVPATNLLRTIHVWEQARMLTMRAQNAGRDELSAEEIRLHFRETQGRNTLSELQAERSVQLKFTPPESGAAGHSEQGRSLSANALNMLYSKEGDYFDSGTATGNVVLSGLPMGEPGQPEIKRLSADAVQFHFQPGTDRLKDFHGDGHVQVFYHKPADPATEAPPQEFRTSSSFITATFREDDGTAQSVSQWGNFQYQDSARTASAGRGDYDAQKEIMYLCESPRITDGSGTTTGDDIEYNRRLKILSVRRHVRSILKPKDTSSATPFTNSPGSTSPSIITADDMQYWSDDARARYSGDVQLLSEDGQLQAAVLEVFNSGERVEAQGSVRHLIPRKEAGEKGGSSQRQTANQKTEKDASGPPIHITANQLRYLKAENSIHYLGNVRLTSGDIDMTSESLDAVLDKEGKQIESAIAKGKIEVHQAGRTVRGNIADYSLASGKIVVQGTPAEVWDPTRGKSTARRLTFFTADVRILLENR